MSVGNRFELTTPEERHLALALAVALCTPGDWETINERFKATMEIACRFTDFIAGCDVALEPEASAEDPTEAA